MFTGGRFGEPHEDYLRFNMLGSLIDKIYDLIIPTIWYSSYFFSRHE